MIERYYGCDSKYKIVYCGYKVWMLICVVCSNGWVFI